jgi:hypothetical protein
MPQLTEDDIKKAVQQFDRRTSRRATWDGLYESLAALIRPLRIDVRSRRSPGSMQTQQIFDGTAPKAASDLASALQGSLSPIDMQWFRLTMRYKPLNDLLPVRRWLEECESRLNLYFQHSNFEGEVHEMYQDLVVFGTGNIMIEERKSDLARFGGYQFRTVPPGRYVIAEGPDSHVETVMRLFSLSLEAADTQFPGQLSDASKTKLATHPEEMIQVLHVMRPATRNGSYRRAFESFYVEYVTKKLLAEAYSRKQRFMVPRWSKTSDEEYGRGQGHIVYPDVATLNRAVEMRFKQWAKAIDPPVLTEDDGVLGKLRLQAGTRTVVRHKDSVKSFDTGSRFDVAQFQEADLRQMIRNGFYADKLQLPAKQYMTAYEIQQQVEIMQRELGPTIGRIKNEFLTPLIDNAFDLAFHAGALPPPPQELIAAAQAGLSGMAVEYESPLIRAQRTADIVAVDRTIQSLAPLIRLNPAVMDNYDDDFLARKVGESAGIPASGFRDLDAVASIRQARTQAKQQQLEQASQLQESEIAKNTGAAAKGFASAAPQPTGNA